MEEYSTRGIAPAYHNIILEYERVSPQIMRFIEAAHGCPYYVHYTDIRATLLNLISSKILQMPPKLYG